jgi:hypothetical protein
MHFAKILSVATLPMFLFACGDDSATIRPPSSTETPTDTSKVEIPPNTPDSLLTPIAREYSWNGKGTKEEPYQISSEDELAMLAFYVNDSSMTFKNTYFIQTADIALSKSWNPIGLWGKNADGLGNRPFSGSYDGGSKMISGLTIADTAAYSGLFGLTRDASISNVVLKSVKMTVGSYAGALVGKSESTTIDNCSVEDAEVKGADWVGGLVGEASHVNVANVSVTGVVNGENFVGGVVGRLQDGAFENLSNKADVTGKNTVGGVAGNFASSVKSGSSATDSEGVIRNVLNYGSVTGKSYVGGVVAKLSSTKLEHSGNYGVVTADSVQMSCVGGVVAEASNKSSINEVFNTAAVSAKFAISIGGVIGSLKNSSATNLFNQGAVTGFSSSKGVGGLAGIVDGGESKLESGYNAGKLSSELYVGAVVGKVSATKDVSNVYFNATVDAGCEPFAESMFSSENLPKGMATEEMKAATFVTTLNGANAVWTIDPAKFNGYPVFSWLN